ncbi:542_t:CDS:2 [Funneliformis mosseae]|uniref:542_t:CDS:1 n=1 Tax=Funneliformis mosseae TaxID=27381 RepID=A0A9N8VLU0_FUNMO|nr:542_t:CDS:2 [Funneliformis mosseae]
MVTGRQGLMRRNFLENKVPEWCPEFCSKNRLNFEPGREL